MFVAGALFSVWAIWGAGWVAIELGAILLATGVPVYFIARSSPAAADGRAAPPESAA